jgi:hypothetical protein
MSTKQQKPQTAPEVQIALTQKWISNKNEDLNTGSSSITSTQIISGNMYRLLVFGEWLKQHRVKVSKTFETMKAATAGITLAVEKGGQRGAILKVLAPTAPQSEVPQRQPQEQTEENNQK